MARGRFVNKSMNDNARLEAMPIECVDFFKRVISISDVEGRLRGDSKYLRNVLYPLRESVTSRRVEGWLNVLWNSKDDDTGLGLLERYGSNGKSYIWLPGFDKHQKGLRKDREAASEIPAPPAELIIKTTNKMLSAVQITQVSGDKRTIKEMREEEQGKISTMIKYYEDNTGRMPTPADLEKMIDFSDHYPDGWFEKAVDEVKNSKDPINAPIRYIERILENWHTEGVNPFDKRRTKADKGSPTTTTAKLKEGLNKKLR